MREATTVAESDWNWKSERKKQAEVDEDEAEKEEMITKFVNNWLVNPAITKYWILKQSVETWRNALMSYSSIWRARGRENY